MKKLFASLALAAVVAPVWAATQTVTLSVLRISEHRDRPFRLIVTAHFANA